jgi:hypothetical protein
MKNSNRLIMQAVREAGSVLESIWQSWKESGPCCGIRFSQATVSALRNDPILCSCYEMRM